ncbi:hypothetical protein [Clostridium sp. CTA-6]
MFTKTKLFKNSEGEIAVVFIHDVKYIISIDNNITIVTDNQYYTMLDKLGFIEEVK